MSQGTQAVSNSTGGTYPRLECNRFVVYTSSMNWPLLADASSMVPIVKILYLIQD